MPARQNVSNQSTPFIWLAGLSGLLHPRSLLSRLLPNRAFRNCWSHSDRQGDRGCFPPTKQDAIVKLKAIEGIPTSVISDFETNATFQEASLSALTPSQREQVQEVQTSYNAEVAGATIGTGVAATIGGGLMLVMFIITIPGQIIGFLLILRKKVWKCGQCGYVFERA